MSAETSPRPGHVLVLLCGDLGKADLLDPHALALDVEASLPGTQAEVVDHLCRRPALAEQWVNAAGPGSLVAALCAERSVAPEIELAARRAGLSPLAVQALPLQAICEQAPAPMRRARMLVNSAAARAGVFPGAGPEHLRPALRKRRGRTTRRAFFTLPSLTYRPVPAIDRAICTAASGCQQCVDGCPGEAMRWTGGDIELLRDNCSGCGACVAGCPQRAVEMPGWGPLDIETQLASLLADREGESVAFVCADSPLPSGAWLPVPVRCVSGLPVAALLGPLARGAAAVGLVECRCPSSRRSDIETRVDYCQSLLDALDEPPGRVQLLSMSGDFRLAPPPEIGPLPATGEAEPLRIAGAGADADAIAELALLVERPGLQLRHPFAPTGLLAIDRDACTACGTCASACPTGALALAEAEGCVTLEFTPSRCTACALCVEACPEREHGAIATDRVTDVEAILRGPETLMQEEVAHCRNCGAPVATAGVLDRIAIILGSQFDPRRMAERCSTCRQFF